MKRTATTVGATVAGEVDSTAAAGSTIGGEAGSEAAAATEADGEALAIGADEEVLAVEEAPVTGEAAAAEAASATGEAGEGSVTGAVAVASGEDGEAIGAAAVIATRGVVTGEDSTTEEVLMTEKALVEEIITLKTRK